MARPQRDLSPDSLIGHFGLEIRTFRNDAGLSQTQLADALGCTGQWVGAVELADKGPSEAFALDLDTYFQTNGSFHRLWKTIKRASQRSATPAWFKPWIPIEQKAKILKTWQPLVVPGLLQTPAYARAILQSKPGITQSELEKQVTARIERQQLLVAENPPLLWAILDESVLWRSVGSEEIMRHQLAALIEATAVNHVTVQVVPKERTGTAGLSGPFVIATMDGGPDIVYLDDAAEGRVASNSSEATEVLNWYDSVRADALPAQASVDLVSKVRQDRWMRL
ncbi:helix-turn-helix domain-containing protein [Actinoallomurus purpureus]|uniref:helix-turn-helix domain-containing protein n=1 Tax=Actinoallomurus purpureus TaxID=478114 RepID=UPI0020927700|nr:helix-turn-helix transcriptional regulator [Actinoallomurus purpureus]MCO6011038.1 helix-turn-helix domain-containing protein [Actinoallomurus purpureus]